MLSVGMPAYSPDGFIAISASSGSYGSLMDGECLPNHAAKHTIAETKPTENAAVEEIKEFAGESVPPLRSTPSGKGILKTSSGELDSQGAEKIKRAVSWHDFEGKNLQTVREFTPSDDDDAELLYNPGEPKQCCVIC